MSAIDANAIKTPACDTLKAQIECGLKGISALPERHALSLQPADRRLPQLLAQWGNFIIGTKLEKDDCHQPTQ